MEYIPTKCFIEDNNIVTTATIGGLLVLSLILNIVQCIRSCRDGRDGRDGHDGRDGRDGHDGRRTSDQHQLDMELGTGISVPIVRREFQLSSLTRNVISNS